MREGLRSRWWLVTEGKGRGEGAGKVDGGNEREVVRERCCPFGRAVTASDSLYCIEVGETARVEEGWVEEAVVMGGAGGARWVEGAGSGRSSEPRRPSGTAADTGARVFARNDAHTSKDGAGHPEHVSDQ